MDLKSLIRTIDDFPRPGIGFKDLTPVLANPEALGWMVDTLADRYRGRVDAVVGIESRGFVVGAPLAYALGTGLTIIRKPGKLPHEVHAVSYELEYGSDTLEVHRDAHGPGERVLLVDDLLATGGTAEAAISLMRKLEVEIVEFAFMIELGFLRGSDRLAPVPTHSLVRYDD